MKNRACLRNSIVSFWPFLRQCPSGVRPSCVPQDPLSRIRRKRRGIRQKPLGIRSRSLKRRFIRLAYPALSCFVATLGGRKGGAYFNFLLYRFLSLLLLLLL